MKWSLNLGKIAGIRIQVHWTFLILILWIFFMHYNMGHGWQQAMMGVTFILLLFVCVTLHELGHALTAKRFGIATQSISLLPIGGLASMEKMPEKPSQELWVALAGPLVNVLIAAGLYVYLNTQGELPSLEEMDHMASSNLVFNLFIANLILAGFNLIPAFPMDGGRVLRALLAFKMDRPRATRIAANVGQFLAITFVFFGFFFNFWLVFIGIFIYLGAGAESIHETTKSVLTKYRVADVVMRKFTMIHAYEPLSKAVQLLLNSQEKAFLVTENNEITGVLTQQQIIRGLADKGKDVPVKQVMQKSFMILHPEMNLQEVYSQISHTGNIVNPVYKEGKLLGVVDLENIKELLMVESASGKAVADIEKI